MADNNLPFDFEKTTEMCVKRLKGHDPDHMITTVIKVEQINHYLLHEDDRYFDGNANEIGLVHSVKVIGKGLHFDCLN